MWVSETQDILNLQWVTVETNKSFCTKVARGGKNHFPELLRRQVEGGDTSPSAVMASQPAGGAWPTTSRLPSRAQQFRPDSGGDLETV